MALAVALLVIAGGTGAAVTVNTSVALPVPPLLVALRVTLNVPATVGVPEITPVEVLRARPVGRPEAPKLVGELLAVIW